MTTAEELQKAFGFISMAELHYLQELARGIKQSPVVVLNIGAGPGTSGVGFAESREDLILHTCDMSDKSNPHGCLESERDWMKRAGQWHRWEKTWFQHHMSSHDLDDIWAKLTNFLTIDLLFIDGDHTPKGCAEDIYGFFPYVRMGGLIAVHDYDKINVPLPPGVTERKVIDGVTKAVNESLPEIAKYYGRVESTVVYQKEYMGGTYGPSEG